MLAAKTVLISLVSAIFPQLLKLSMSYIVENPEGLKVWGKKCCIFKVYQYTSDISIDMYLPSSICVHIIDFWNKILV